MSCSPEANLLSTSWSTCNSTFSLSTERNHLFPTRQSNFPSVIATRGHLKGPRQIKHCFRLNSDISAGESQHQSSHRRHRQHCRGRQEPARLSWRQSASASFPTSALDVGSTAASWSVNHHVHLVSRAFPERVFGKSCPHVSSLYTSRHIKTSSRTKYSRLENKKIDSPPSDRHTLLPHESPRKPFTQPRSSDSGQNCLFSPRTNSSSAGCRVSSWDGGDFHPGRETKAALCCPSAHDTPK